MKLAENARMNAKWIEIDKNNDEAHAFQFLSEDVEMKDEPEEKVLIQEQQIFSQAIRSEQTGEELYAVAIKEEEESEDDENVQYIAIIQDDESTINNKTHKIEEKKKKKKEIVKITPVDVEEMLRIALEKEQKETPTEAPKKIKKISKQARIRNQLINSRRTCKKCNFLAGHALDLFRHVDESKENCIALYQPTQECFICHKKFMLLTMKISHIKRDHKDMELTGECQTCGKYFEAFKNPVFYERHCQRHFVAPTFVCSFCGKGYYKRESFDFHMTTHSEIYLFCDLCDYKAQNKSLLQHHMKKHCNERRPVCDICSKTVWNLDNHIFSVHKTAKRGCYHCKSCDFCFVHRFQFKLHVPKCNGPTGKKYPPDSVRIPRSELDPSCQINEIS
jgi:hypothetical protein